MIKLNQAKQLVLDAFPNEKIVGKPMRYKGKYAFELALKDLADDEVNYDANVATVDMNTGEVSSFNMFVDYDYMVEAQPIEEET